MGIALRLALREARAGLKGFRILLACLALGVAAIAASGSFQASVQQALSEDSRQLLGGDLEIRQSYQPVDGAKLSLPSHARSSAIVEMRAMARGQGDSRRLVELKAVDSAYPLVGALSLSHQAGLGQVDGHFGAFVDPHVVDSLGLKVGDLIHIGDTSFQIRATLLHEPDRVATALAFGPRVMISAQALDQTDLVRPGALINFATRIVVDGPLAPVKAQLTAQNNPDWRLRDAAQAAPGVERFLDNLTQFLTLVGLTSLLVGGIGVANAVKAWLDSRLRSIAILKCIGASSDVIFATYFLLIGGLAGIGILVGLLIGAFVPWIVITGFKDALPIAARLGIYPHPLILAAGFGVLTTLVFTLWPLGRAKLVPATALFRDLVAPVKAWPPVTILGLLALAALGLCALAIFTAERPPLALGFVIGAALTMAVFFLIAKGLKWLALRLSDWRALSAPIRMALAALHRPGTAIVSITLSLGLGLTVLVAIASIEGNLTRQFGDKLPKVAPSFFFIDVQPHQVEPFKEIVAEIDPKAEIHMAPMVRGRITHIKGVPVAEVPIDPEARWAVQGDRGFTSAGAKPEGTTLASGQWWPEEYQGPFLASMDEKLAKGFGVQLGDKLKVSVLGREMEVQITSTRIIEWQNLNMNFAFILSPNTLKGAPHTYLATLHTNPELESKVERALTDRLTNISAIRVKEALLAVTAMLKNADMAVRLTALVTLAAGALVLAGAVMAGHRRRIFEAVVLKVLGAKRHFLWKMWVVEFAVIGFVTGIMAAGIGSLAAWAVLTHVMRAQHEFLPLVVVGTIAVSLLASVLAGFIAAHGALKARPAAHLRTGE